jgi:hypothetical protein
MLFRRWLALVLAGVTLTLPVAIRGQTTPKVGSSG